MYVCRKNEIPEHPRKHPHVYSLSQSQDPGFPAAFLRKQTEAGKAELRDTVIEHIASLALSLGLTLSQASQSALITFVVELIEIGSRMGTLAQEIDLHDVIGRISPYSIRQSIGRAGEKLKEKDMTKAKEVRFINIACDSGTVLGKTVIHALLTNPSHASFPMILKVCDNDHFDAEKYYLLFNSLCEECIAQGLIVCGIIIDNLRAQVRGLKEMLRVFKDDPYKASIIHVPCFAHMTNLVCIHAKDKSVCFARIVAGVKRLVAVLRHPKARQELNETCEKICETRWLYIVDILMWMFARKEKLNTFLLASDNNTSNFDKLPEEWECLLEILKPLKYFTYSVESSDCSLWEVKVLVDNVMQTWRRMWPEVPEALRTMFVIIVSEFVSLVKRNAYDEVVTSYCLTELGRQEIRSKEEGFQTELDTEEVIPFQTKRMQRVDCCLDCNDISSLDVIPVPLEGEEPDVEIDLSQEMKEEEDFEEPGSEQEDETPHTIDILLSSPVYNVSFEIAFNRLRLMGQKHEIAEAYIYEIFRSWIFSNKSTGPTRMEKQCSPDIIWRRAPSHDARWRDFASIALRFVTLGASEADCERSLSKQKDCQGLHTTMIKSDLLEWRLRAAHSKPKEV